MGLRQMLAPMAFIIGALLAFANLPLFVIAAWLARLVAAGAGQTMVGPMWAPLIAADVTDDERPVDDFGER